MKKYVLGIDVGGTNVRMGLVNAKGEIAGRSGFSTKDFIRDPGMLIRQIADVSKKLIRSQGLSKKEIKGIGIGLPGLIDPIKGIVHVLPNIPGWKDVKFKKIFQEKTGMAAFLENDVNLIALGEWRFGAGVGAENMICMTLGTGVGGGLILENRLYRGAGFAAGELGHVPINEKGPACNCGGTACMERYVGNRYLQIKAQSFFGKKVSLEEVERAATRGSARAVRFWRETAEHIGNGLVGVVNFLNPELIVIGGGVSNAHKYLFPTIRRIIRERSMKVQGKMVKIVKAKLGNNAGIIGAQVLVRG